MQDGSGVADQAPHLRADAERNRRRLLDAARVVFAEQGPDASVAEIRQRAGVGQGTVFRHFATKERLLAAIVLEGVEEMAAIGDTLLDADDPGEGLLEFMRTSARMDAEDRCLGEAMCLAARTDGEVRAAQARLIEIVGTLLRRAQDAGAVRSDVTAEDIIFLRTAACRATVEMREVAPELWRRYLDVIFDGLRPAAARPLSHDAPTLEQLDVLFPRPSESDA